MSTIRDQCENVETLRTGLVELLEGMDYCLDWKPDDSQWSAREVVYHLLDTPPGGTPSVVRGIFSGDVSEYEIWSDRTNMTEVRSTQDMEGVQEDIGAFFAAFGDALAAAGDADLQDRAVVVHQRTRGEELERTLEGVLAGFDRHWRGHLEQLGELRAALGL